MLRKRFEEFDDIFKVLEEENRVVQAIPLGTRGGGKRTLFSSSWPKNQLIPRQVLRIKSGWHLKMPANIAR